jgi:hypothetical protein
VLIRVLPSTPASGAQAPDVDYCERCSVQCCSVSLAPSKVTNADRSLSNSPSQCPPRPVTLDHWAKAPLRRSIAYQSFNGPQHRAGARSLAAAIFPFCRPLTARNAATREGVNDQGPLSAARHDAPRFFCFFGLFPIIFLWRWAASCRRPAGCRWEVRGLQWEWNGSRLSPGCPDIAPYIPVPSLTLPASHLGMRERDHAQRGLVCRAPAAWHLWAPPWPQPLSQTAPPRAHAECFSKLSAAKDPSVVNSNNSNRNGPR